MWEFCTTVSADPYENLQFITQQSRNCLFGISVSKLLQTWWLWSFGGDVWRIEWRCYCERRRAWDKSNLSSFIIGIFERFYGGSCRAWSFGILLLGNWDPNMLRCLSIVPWHPWIILTTHNHTLDGNTYTCTYTIQRRESWFMKRQKIETIDEISKYASLFPD